MKWKMLFKIGVTIIILVAVYMYYAIDKLDKQGEDSSLHSLPKHDMPSGNGHVNQQKRTELNFEILDDESDKGNIKEKKNNNDYKPDPGKPKNKPVKIEDVDDGVENRKKASKDNRNNNNNDKVEKDNDKKVDDRTSDKGTDNGKVKVEKSKVKGTEQVGNINGGHSDVKKDDIEDGRKNFVDLDKPGAKKEINKEILPLSVPTDGSRKSSQWKKSLHISVVCCGDRTEESLVMLKSAILFSKSRLVFHIFAESELHKGFKEQLDFWPPAYRARMEYHIYDISFPTSGTETAEEWKKLFKPCAAQRLFIPDLLVDVDSIVYVDTDVLFLSPVDDIWSFFSKFNSTQLAAVTPEHEDRAIGWYNRFARHPFYGELGINSGVMLMNLTRLRASSWLQSMKNYHKEYKLKITFGDQDLINIYFHFYPGQLYVMSCEWNYRPDHCMYMSVCKPAEASGAYVLHGCRRVWHEEKQPAFKVTYRAFKEHRLGASIQYDLLEAIGHNLMSANVSNCGKLPQLFTQQIQLYTRQHQEGT